LVDPDPSYQISYLEALAEFQAEGRYLDVDAVQLAADFPGFVQALRDRANPAMVRPGRVPDTALWLVAEERFLGRVSIRHTLNEQLRRFGGHVGYEIRPSARRRGHGTRILALALARAPDLGLSRVQVSCAVDNVASRKIIERSGGELEDVIEIADWPVPVMRFWISTAAPRSPT
jgi:predicted acetyltransferase